MVQGIQDSHASCADEPDSQDRTRAAGRPPAGRHTISDAQFASRTLETPLRGNGAPMAGTLPETALLGMRTLIPLDSMPKGKRST